MRAEPMAAGARLDGAIARQVFGYRIEPLQTAVDVQGTETIHGWGYYRPEDGLFVNLPRFSQDWTAMGTLVEHLHSQGWHLRLWYDEDLACWACRFYRRGAMHEWRAEEHADSAPRACALAALQTVGDGEA